MARPSLKSLFLVVFLVAALAGRAMANAVICGGSGDMMGAVAQPVSSGQGGQLLADLMASICAQGKAAGTAHAEQADCPCQACLPAAYQLSSTTMSSDVLVLREVRGADPRPHPQILPPSRRLIGDGPSRAPPAIA
jgi:hypothetical protein